jgi:4-hydroxy-3-methylbut-2-enyl diphosphate reductase
MKLIIAKNIGFCSGVKRAIQIAEKSLKQDKKPVQFLGSIVHNEEVIDKFRNLGGTFIKDIKDAIPGTVIIQAHGVPPLKTPSPSVSLKDATCPLVKKVQLLASKLEKAGCQVVIIGDKKHSETKGIKGYAKKSIIVENKKQAERLSDFERIGVVVQTTQNLKSANEILNILKSKSKNVKFFNTLCPEVKSRQIETQRISKEADGVLIIGSKSSANTNRLKEIAQKETKNVWILNTYKDLNKSNMSKIKILGITSGASTPDWEIEKIIKCLRQM